MNNIYKYYAFISYKREDEQWAKWLQDKLENYSIPSSIRKERTDIPKQLRPIFRDKTDVLPGPFNEQLLKELALSKYLIVVCSPRSAQSESVGREIKHFIDNDRANYIIPFIIEGTPYSGNSENECYHEVIKDNFQFLLGVNLNDAGKENIKQRKQRAVLQVISKIIGVPYDSLKQRHQKKRRNSRIISVLAIISFLMAACLSLRIVKRNEVYALNSEAMRYISEGRIQEALELQFEAVKRCQTFKVAKNHTERSLRKVVERAKKAGMQYNIHLKDSIDVFTLSPDECYIATSNAAGDISLWLTNCGLLFRELKGHTAKIRNVNFSPDGQLIASTSEDGTTIIWNTYGGKVQKITDYNNSEAIFSPDGRHLLTYTAYENSIRIYDLRNWENMTKFETDHSILEVRYSHDGEKIIACEPILITKGEQLLASEGNVTVWDKYGSIISSTKQPRRHGPQFNYSGTKYILTTGLFSPEVPVCDSKTGRIISVINTEDYVTNLTFSPTEDILMSFHSDNTLKIWNACTGIKTYEVKMNTGINHACFTPDGKEVLIFADDKSAYRFNTKTNTLSAGFTTGIISSPLTGSYGHTLIAKTGDFHCCIWDIRKYPVMFNFMGPVFPLFEDESMFIYEGRFELVSGSERYSLNSVQIRDKRNEKIVFTHKYASIAAISPDMQYVVLEEISGRNSSIVVYDILSSDEMQRIDDIPYYVEKIAFHPTYGEIYCRLSDGKEHIIDFPTFYELVKEGKKILNEPMYP